MRSDIERALKEAHRDKGVKVLVITGEERAFCAGLDAKEAGRIGSAYKGVPLSLLSPYLSLPPS